MGRPLGRISTPKTVSTHSRYPIFAPDFRQESNIPQSKCQTTRYCRLLPPRSQGRTESISLLLIPSALTAHPLTPHRHPLTSHRSPAHPLTAPPTNAKESLGTFSKRLLFSKNGGYLLSHKQTDRAVKDPFSLSIRNLHRKVFQGLPLKRERDVQMSQPKLPFSLEKPP